MSAAVSVGQPTAAGEPTAYPGWFGPEAAPLFGWWHLPAGGRAHAAVVLLAPLGREQSITSSTYRYLACRLAAQGFAVLRPDLHGVGDSSGNQEDDDRAGAWRESISVAVAEARRLVPGHVSLVAMRGTALLAVLQAEQDPQIDALVLWDPVVTGRAFLREQQAIRAIAIGSPGGEPGVAAGLGFRLRGSDAEAMRSIDLGSGSGPLADKVLVLTRGGRAADARVERRMTGLPVQWEEVHGQEDLLVLDGYKVRIPRDTCDWLADWFSALGIAADAPVAPPARRDVVMSSGGVPIRERVEVFGEAGLFAVVSGPSATAAPVGPAVIFVGNELHTGPGRLWVELSRSLAARGVVAMRLDVSGLGESGVRSGQDAGIAFAMEALDDVVLAARHLLPADPADVVLVGLCSGANAAVEAGLVLGSRGVALINLIPGFVPPEKVGGGVDPRRQTAQPPHPLIDRIGHQAWARRLAHRLPQTAWSLAHRLRVFRSPATALELLSRRGVDTLLLEGGDDAGRFLPFAARHLRRLERSGTVQFTVLPELDHPMLSPSPSSAAAQLLTSFILGFRRSPDAG